MPTTRYQSSNGAVDVPGGADFTNDLLSSPPGSVTLNGSIAAGATEESYFYTPLTQPGALGLSAGTITFLATFTASAGNLTLALRCDRMTPTTPGSAANVSATGTLTATQSVTVTTLTFTPSLSGLGTWAAGDRLRIACSFVNSAGAARTFSMRWGTAADLVTFPWTEDIYPAQRLLRCYGPL